MSTVSYPELVRFAQLHAVVGFCYLGALHRTDAAMKTFLGEVSLRRSLVECRLDDEDLLTQISEASGSLFVIDPRSERLTVDQNEERLSNLRPVIQEARASGTTVLFLSSRPLGCYPALAGSSILADAETVRIRPLAQEEAEEAASDAGVEGDGVGRVATFCRGSRALLNAYIRVELSNASGNEKRALAENLERTIAATVFDELGAELNCLVETWVFEAQLESVCAEDFPNEAIQSALALSGLASRDDAGIYHVLPFARRDVWVESLGSWLTAVVEPPESWSKVAAELFRLERMLRHEMGRSLKERHGPSWRSEGLVLFAASILELARRDGVPAVQTVNDLREPLDWLQLSELLELAGATAAGATWLGIRRAEWDGIARDLLPTRHRVAHMRLIRAGDLDLVRRTIRLIEVRNQLNSSHAM